MKAKVTIIDFENNSKEIINVENIIDKQNFSYNDSYNALNEITIFDDGISILRKAKTHNTKINLRNESFIEITSSEGKLNFYPKVIANNINNDNIYLVYEIDHSKKSIKIEFVKDK